jgi:ABC-2 type transport system permease protein
VGIAIGVVLAWWWGRIAYRRLTARGPEILATVGQKV